jgi:membrane protease YdiL (CAAX protease family)
LSTTAALVVVLALLVVVNVWVHVGPRYAHMVTGPVAALVLLLVARAAGLTWEELGLAGDSLLRGLAYGGAAAGATASVYLIALRIPIARKGFLDRRYRVPMRAAVLMGLVQIPLATVVFEEIAFRSVLWGLLESDYDVVVATAVSSVLFGLWHVLPALDVTRTSTAIGGEASPAQRRKVVLTVAGTVLFTAAAGVVFAELRRRSGSVVAPLCLHWATNGLAVVAAARVWSATPSSSQPSPRTAARDTPPAP